MLAQHSFKPKPHRAAGVNSALGFLELPNERRICRRASFPLREIALPRSPHKWHPYEEWVEGATHEIDWTDTSDDLVPAQG